MKRALLPTILLCLCTTLAASVAVVPGYDVSWSTIDGGTAVIAGGSFQLTGTVGQPEAGGIMAGGAFGVTGGFWSSGDDTTCPQDISGSDGAIDVVDLLALLASWGGNGPGAGIAPPDDVVDVVDLLALLAAWGLCPE